MLVNMPSTGPMGLHSDWTLALKKPAVTVEMDQITDSVQVKKQLVFASVFSGIGTVSIIFEEYLA